jgi:hypothetical protein
MRETPKNPKSKYSGHVAVVRFTHPVEGLELISGVPLVSNLHRYFAHDTIESEDQTILVDAQGEIVNSLPTHQIASIEWEEFPHQPTFSVLRSAWRFNGWERYQASWTLEETKDLRREFESGLEIAEIAELHKRTWGAIVGRLLQMCDLIWKEEPESEKASPEDPDELAEVPVNESNECIHGFRFSTCVTCRKPPEGINARVWVTKGGKSFHNRRSCAWLLKGQERAGNAGLENHPVTATTPGDATADGYEPCGFCCQENR